MQNLCVISMFKLMGEELKGPPRISSGVPTLKEMRRTDCVSEDLPEVLHVIRGWMVGEWATQGGRIFMSVDGRCVRPSTEGLQLSSFRAPARQM